MTDWFRTLSRRQEGAEFKPSRLLRRVVVLAFALIQAVLVARILVDLGVIPVDGGFGELVVTYSDVLAAPVQGIGSGLSALFGGDSIEAIAGEGLDPVVVTALIGWSLVESLVMRVVRKFEAV